MGATVLAKIQNVIMPCVNISHFRLFPLVNAAKLLWFVSHYVYERLRMEFSH